MTGTRSPRTRPAVIAHRGASGYLPEHTLAAKALAHAMGADYLEQDVVISADNHALVLHDIYLEHVTDVVEQFPDRARDDGRWYARDFRLDELRRLNVTERLADNRKSAHYPQRFPAFTGRFSISTLAEEIEFIQGLNRATGRIVGLYPEIKRPAWHRQEGVEAGDLMLECLAQYGYESSESPVYVQCFDFDELVRLRDTHRTRLKLVQLLGENAWKESPSDFDDLKTERGLQDIAGVADAIGPWMGQIISPDDAGPDGKPLPLVDHAHAAGLDVHPYTFRADDLPAGFATLEQLIDWSITVAGIDGFFTDFPDRAARALDSLV